MRRVQYSRVEMFVRDEREEEMGNEEGVDRGKLKIKK